jgi:hypothetical protein
MQRVIAIVPLTVCLALSVTKADSISLASSPIEARVVLADRAAPLQWAASPDGSGSTRILPLSFFDKTTQFSSVTIGSTVYLFFSTLGFGANYPVQRRATEPAHGRRAALEYGTSAHAARGGIEEFGRRMYRLFFETRVRERKAPRPSD